MSIVDTVKLYYHKLGSPKYFYEISSRFLPWLALITALLLALGLVWGLLYAPADYQQGNSYRIIFIHVPSASLSMTVYGVMAVSAAIGLIWKMKLAEMVAKSCAVIGASFAFLALVTGSIWGKPTWGTWWIWDARLTSMLVLFFFYVSIIALNNAIEDAQNAAKTTAVLALVGVVNLPIVKYSVDWWNTLHQPATLKLTEKPAMQLDMLIPLLLMIAGFYFLFATLLIMRTRVEIIHRERRSAWVRKMAQLPSN